MAVNAIVSGGEIIETASQASVSQASNPYDKNSFLQLLVAQMKFQDPLEPTSNTEYISQYATFTQVEELQNMSSTLELSRASSYVGQYVEVTTQTEGGNSKTIEGYVDYVTYQNNKAYVSIEDNLYSAADVSAVLNTAFLDAKKLAETFTGAMGELPELDYLTVDSKEAVETLHAGFNAMSSYQQSFIPEDVIKLLKEYVLKMAELTAVTEKEDGTEEKALENTEDETKVEAVENAAAEAGITTE